MLVEEAKKKWCPLARIANFSSAANRKATNEPLCNEPLCIVSRCMAWRWNVERGKDDRFGFSTKPSTTDGYCGAFGKPEMEGSKG